VFVLRRESAERLADEIDQILPSAPKGGPMNKFIMFASAAILSAGIVFVSNVVGAQGMPQTVELAKVDVQKLAAGYRASKVIGSNVVNEENEVIGKVDDLLVSLDGKEPYAVLSIGGFLGMGTHLVAVPYETLKSTDDKIMLPGGTKSSLRMLPEFKYASK
jgi:PRC-barrel domain